MSLLDFTMHPGEVLKELYLKPLGLSSIKFAEVIHVPRSRVERLVRGDCGITPDTAFRLAKALQTTPEMWLTMQNTYDLAMAKDEVDVSAIKPLPAISENTKAA
ncbi:HigA family addiction module antitoxin [Cognatishimia maritima]|uniref:Addiction module antidote protein, HigA family n=1 Tax=Cognatishimia maritima TaxID=870908 RepID=A0A1M5JJD2_9RHOB|nr:HigA family addiction module antitoxin [Cognatishimia maritima]SHG40672.1 addiction module antidote protein, HigA family [Cognatishimia maritima]